MSKKEYKNALGYLEDVGFDDEIMSALIIGLQADCYSELNETAKAADLYMKAAKERENIFTSPLLLMKAGQHYEAVKNYESAVKAYKMIRDKFKEAQQAQFANKYIARAMAKMGQSPD